MDSRHSLSDHWLTSPTYPVDMHSIWPARISWTICLTVGGRAFDIAGPQSWNSLPAHVISAETLTTFRQRLKHFCLRNHLAYSGPSSRLCYLGHFKHLWSIDWWKMAAEIAVCVIHWTHRLNTLVLTAVNLSLLRPVLWTPRANSSASFTRRSFNNDWIC